MNARHLLWILALPAGSPSAQTCEQAIVAGGNLQGTDGSFCARGAINTFSCN